MKIKLTWKIWLWIIFLILSLIAIFPPQNIFKSGIEITNVNANSTEFNLGLRQGQIINSIDGKIIKNVEDYSSIIQKKFPSETNIKTILGIDGKEYILYSKIAPQITVSDIKRTNLKAGLDLVGGSRALVKAENHDLTSSEVNDLVQITQNRLNAFGLSDIKVVAVSDSPLAGGNHYMSIEIAGATPKDLEELISQQGKFEGKIGNDTVFTGGKQDITSVGRSGQDAGISSCQQSSSDSYFCEFKFTIYLSQAAAERQAALTKNLSVNTTSQGNYLSKNLDLYLDDKSVDSLRISEGLRGMITTQVSISGSGTGTTKADALKSAEDSMKKLQTILITGSLPFKLQIIKLDTISPTLGKSFMKYIFLAGLAALLSVAIIVFIRYRGFKSSLFPLIICTSEIIITLGIAAIWRWNLDLPSIAGILAAIGTGVDDQIVLLDETKHKEQSLNVKQKIKMAFGIILGAYATAVVSLLPLWWAGAGLLKGFVFTTLTGITIGVLITRPAFADIVRMVEEKNAS